MPADEMVCSFSLRPPFRTCVAPPPPTRLDQLYAAVEPYDTVQNHFSFCCAMMVVMTAIAGYVWLRPQKRVLAAATATKLKKSASRVEYEFSSTDEKSFTALARFMRQVAASWTAFALVRGYSVLYIVYLRSGRLEEFFFKFSEVGDWLAVALFVRDASVAFEGIELTQGNDLELLFYAVKRQCACWKKIRVTFGFKALTIAQLTYQLMYDHSTNVTCAF